MGSNGSIPVVDGEVNKINGNNGWRNAVDFNKSTMVHTDNGSNSSITLKLGGNMPLIHRIDVINRSDCCLDRIIGCELQVLDSTMKNIIQKWDFSSVSPNQRPCFIQQGRWSQLWITSI